MRDQITQLRKEIPTVPAKEFESHGHLDSGSEADVFHDVRNGIVYKLYPIKDGKLGGYVPGQFRLDRGGDIRISMGDMPTVQDLLSRMERGNTHGLTPNELVAVTPEGHMVFAQPFVEGRGVTQKNMKGALARAGVHLLSEMGATSGVAKLPDGRWVVYDDLHPGNVRTMPGGRVEIIDANSRELDPYEVADLQTLGKLPPEKQPSGKPLPVKAPPEPVKHYDNATLIAPMVETHHGTQHTWEPEKKIEHEDGRVEWIHADDEVPQGARVIKNAPAGRVRADKVLSGEGNIAFGWGVNYSAQERKLAESYRKNLSEGADPRAFITEIIPGLKAPSRATVEDALRQYNETRALADHSDIVDLVTKVASGYDSKSDTYTPSALAALKQLDRVMPPPPKGNVYTLHLDVNDPELIDWYKPVKDQIHVVDKLLAKHGMDRESARAAHAENERLAGVAEDLQIRLRELERTTEPRDENEEARVALKQERAEKAWHDHYISIPSKLGTILNRTEEGTTYGGRLDGEKLYEMLTDLTGSKRKASELLESAGVPGVIYLDRESRDKPKFEFDIVEGGKKRTLGFQTQESAESVRDDTVRSYPETVVSDIRKGKITNNYVIFDPERIKVHAKNGEVVGTAADEMPLAPAEPKYEPVTIAPSIDPRDLRDDTDLAVAPMAGRNERKRWPWPWQEKAEQVAGYKAGGMLSPQAQLSRPVGNIVQEHKQEQGAITTSMQHLVRGLEKAMKQSFGKKPTNAQFKEVQTALGNIDNRLSQAQYQQALRISDPARREAFIRAEHANNVVAFKLKQQAALSNLPDAVRDAVIDMRNALDEQTQELLRDPGLDADLKARISTDQGVFLHSNAYQHFENDVWGKYVKSNDPEAQRIRRAAEVLFKNEIIGELAHDYQVANPGTSNAAAIAAVSTSGAIPQMVKTRLAAYLRKSTDQVTRIHMLTGKMPVGESEGGKLFSLQRESIPKEIRELWGQWDEPKANFVKTYSLLAKHNADIRMQNRILAEGSAQGYIWKRSTAATTPLPDDLVPLGKPGDHGPLSDAYGPQLLKDGLANYNTPAVQQLFTGLNRFALMTKTIGSIASGVHNFFGNIAFTISNGNLPWLVVHFPKGVLTTMGKGTREEHAELVRLGIFDSDLTLNETESIYKAIEVGAELEKKIGLPGGIYGALKMLERAARPVTGTVGKVATGFKNFYIGADNFWKYINYKAELSKQQWFNAGRSTPLSLEEMKQNAARMVQDTLPNRERVSEWVKRSVGSQSLAGQFVGPFFTFPLEAGRTMINNGYHAGREMFSPDSSPRERAFGVWRVAGMLGMISAPMLMSMLSKWMNHYNDDDEAALRASLPDYQKNSSYLVMLPRDENKVPRYMDASFLNPYGYYHSAAIAAYRAFRSTGSVLKAGGDAIMSLAGPLMTIQPGIGSVMDVARNSDSLRGGAKVRNTEASWRDQSIDIADRMIRGFAPGTAQNMYRTYLAEQGYKEPKSGRAYELGRELESLIGIPHVETLDTKRATASAVSRYKNRMGNAMRLLNDKMGAQGTVALGEVTAAYEQANKQAFEIFSEMNKSYKNMLKLGMKKRDIEDAMEVGFGTEIRKGGLSKNRIDDIARGVFYPIEISDAMDKDVSANFPDRYKEYQKVLKTKKKQAVVP